jgi:protein TonB
MSIAMRHRGRDDHLLIAVFVAALLHGLLILGVRFAAPPNDGQLPALEVMLVPAGENEEANLHAPYMSDRNQAGAGTTRDRVRASLPEPTPAGPVERGQSHEATPEMRATGEPAGESSTVAARALLARRALSGTDGAPATQARLPLDVRPVPQIAVGAMATDDELALRGRSIADGRLLADTRESQIAGYLDGWKRRIEQVGTLNFPNEARRRSLSGNPVLEVAIGADGQLQQVLVRRTSGYSELDHAAMNIVRLASPFDPFPAALRDRYPVLRFAYEWQFIRGQLGDGAVWSDDR